MFSRQYERRPKRTDAEQTSNEQNVARFLSPHLSDNLNQIVNQLGNSPDVIVKRFEIGANRTRAGAVFVDGISDQNAINHYILHALMLDVDSEVSLDENESVLAFINEHALSLGNVVIVKDWDSIILSLLGGHTILFIDNATEAISGNTKGGEQRAITEASTQVVIRGPKDAFTESIGTNISLVRRRIKSPDVRLESFKIGSTTQTNVAIMFIRGIAKERLIEEIRSRLQSIRIETLSGSEHLEELIQDQSMTPFSTIMNTERPDTAAGHLLAGRIIVFVDGTPFNLIAPTTFYMNFISVEDYYERPEAALAIQLLRYTALIISLFGPSIYIAAITFHQEMIPTALLLSLASQRETVPFPAFIEAFMMEFTFEILREAGIRMPRAIGQAVSIVGALVLGQAAVEAGIISSAMVIVVALTGISSFAAPSYNTALTIRLIRFCMMAAAGLLGYYGIAIFSIILLSHMCGLTSLGVPYMTPSFSYVPEGQRDTLFGVPLMNKKTKPPLPLNGSPNEAHGNDDDTSSSVMTTSRNQPHGQGAK